MIWSASQLLHVYHWRTNRRPGNLQASGSTPSLMHVRGCWNHSALGQRCHEQPWQKAADWHLGQRTTRSHLYTYHSLLIIYIYVQYIYIYLYGKIQVISYGKYINPHASDVALDSVHKKSLKQNKEQALIPLFPMCQGLKCFKTPEDAGTTVRSCFLTRQSDIFEDVFFSSLPLNSRTTWADRNNHGHCCFSQIHGVHDDSMRFMDLTMSSGNQIHQPQMWVRPAHGRNPAHIKSWALGARLFVGGQPERISSWGNQF